MSVSSNARVKLGALVAAASVAVFGLSVSSAQAVIRPLPTTIQFPAAPADDPVIGSMTAQLSVARAGNGYYSVRVAGVVRMTQADASALISRGYRVTWRLWGSDPLSDDALFGPDPASVLATPQGLSYSGLRVTTHGVLNEDDSFFDDHDELIAGARLLSPTGATVASAQSNEVGGYF